MSVSVIVPVLNEIDGLRWFVPEMEKYKAYYDEVIYVDGGSTDGSLEFLQGVGATVMVQQRNGLTAAMEEAFSLTTGDFIITMSPDGNCRPLDLEMIPNGLVPTRNSMGGDFGGYIFSRYHFRESADDDFLTRNGNKFFTWLVNLLFGEKYTDTLTIFRAYTRESIFKLSLNNISNKNWIRRKFKLLNSWEIASVCRAKRYSLFFQEISSYEPKRIGGKRKLCIPLHGTAALIQIIIERIGV